MHNLCSELYMDRKEALLKQFITKDFMVMLQNEMIRIFEFKSNYLLGDDLYHWSCSGTYEALKSVCKYYHAQELIEFLDEIEWYKYDDCMSEICYSYARKYNLYTPKRRWRNIWKAGELF